MRKNIFLLLSLCFLIFSCQKDEEPSITTNQTEFTVSNVGGSQAVSFESNMSWTTRSSESWCSVSPSSGEASIKGTTATISVNDTYGDRSCTVTITAGGLSKTLTINQSSNSGLLVTQDKYDLTNDVATIEVEVKANVDYDVTISDDWIIKSTTRALSSSKLSFNIAKNSSFDSRDGSITIKQKNGSLSSTIRVYQSQKDAIILTNKTQSLSKKAQTLEVELKTNVDFEVIIPNAAKSWVSYTTTRALRTETLLLNIAANEEYDARTTKVYVKNKATNLQDTLTINQSANLGLIVTPDKYDLGDDATTIEVEVKANVEFDVTIVGDWITKVATRGLITTKLQFNIVKNNSYDNRAGSITIKQKNGALSSTIKVYQSQKDAIIVSNKTENLSIESQTLEVELKTNVDFEVIIPAAAKNWVSYTPTRALRTETLILNIAKNENYDPRTTEIYVKNKATNLQDTLTINQSANSGLLVTQDKYDLSNEATEIEVEVKANVEFDVTISGDWISKVSTRGLTSTKLHFAIAKNKSYDNRNGAITIKQKNGTLSTTIKVYQSQQDAIILSNKTENLSIESQTLKVELKTNVDFEVIIPTAAKSWVSYTPTRGLRTETLIINIAKNENYDDRTTEIYVKNKSTNLQDTLTINQSAKLGLLVTQDKYDLTNNASTIKVEVKSNVEFDVIISDNWITKVTTRALSSTKLEFNIAKNTSYDNRSGFITIKQKNGPLSSTINVFQSQEDAIILSNKSEDLSNESQILEVEVNTNVDFELIIPADAQSWVSYTATRALRTETLQLIITSNKSYETRSAKIYVKNRLTSLQNILTINQRPNDKPLLKAPVNKLTDANRLPTFRWSAVKNPARHKFSYIFEYSENLVSWKQSYSLNDTVYNLSAYLDANKQYHWRVSAINSYDGSISYSEVNSFTTGRKTSYFDGGYKLSQTHTKGANPSEIIFLGDGYISEDFEEGGQFDADMDEGIEAFFAVEPYKSYREYFTVYKQAAYSRDRGVKQSDRNIYKDSKFGTEINYNRISTDYEKVYEYAMKIPGLDSQKLNNILVSLVVNEDRYVGVCWSSSIGSAVAVSAVSRSTSPGTHFSNIINHEAGGHGFGRLADEYIASSGTIPEDFKTDIKLWESFGHNSNVDLTGDITQVKWRHFIGLPGYDRVSTFEGAHYFTYGVWRPEVSSCMIFNEKYYNAPSREAIVKRIYKTAGLQYTFEAFMAKDIEKAPSQSAVMQTRSINPLTFVPLSPPVMVE